jgi:hypothetical protein
MICLILLLCYCKKIDKRFIAITEKDEPKGIPTIETIQVFVSKPMNYYNNVSINTLNTFSKEKIADYFTQKLIEDNLIKINDRGDFYEATLTIVKE